MYGIELASLAGKSYAKAQKELRRKVRSLTEVSNIPDIDAKREFLHQLLHTDYVDTADICGLERIREELRELIKYIPWKERGFYTTDLTDEIVLAQWHNSDLENDDLADYKERVNYYVRQVSRRCESGPATDLSCESDHWLCGEKWDDEGYVRPSKAAVYRSGNRCGNFCGFDALGGNSRCDPDDQYECGNPHLM